MGLPSKLRIMFLVSGGGGSLRSLQQAITLFSLPVEIICVIADRKCPAEYFAKEAGIVTKRIIYNKYHHNDLRDIMQRESPDIVITNIHKVIDACTLTLTSAEFLNLHYSLLPAFAGLIGMKTLDAARQHNVSIIGATCHVVDEDVDTGRVLSQGGFSCNWKEDSTLFLQECVFRTACICLIDTIAKRCGCKSKSHENDVYSVNEKNVIFAPHLSIDLTKLDELFWKCISLKITYNDQCPY